MKYTTILVILYGLVIGLCAQIDHKIIILTEQEAGSHESEFGEQLIGASDDKLQILVVNFPINRYQEDDSYKKLCEEVEKGVSVILDMTYTGWPLSQELCLANDLPYLLVDFTIRPFIEVADQFLKNVRNASDAAFIFQNEVELDQSLFYLMANSILRLIVLNQLGPNSVMKLQKIRPMPSYFVVTADSTEMNKLYEAAQSSKLLFRSDTWILVQTDFQPITYDTSNLNCSVITIKLDPVLCCELLDLDEDCMCPEDFKLSDNFLLQAVQLLKETFKTMQKSEVSLEPRKISCSTQETSEKNTISQFFTNTVDQLVQNASSLKFDQELNRLHYKTFFQFSSFNRSFSSESSPFASGEPGSEIQVHNESEIQPLRRFFRVGTTYALPWSYPSIDPESGAIRKDELGNEIWEGYCIDLLETLATNMKFDYQLVPKSSFGSRQPDGSWDGIIGELATGQIDLITTALTMTSEREEVIDFVPPYFDQTGITIVIRKALRKTSIFKFMTVLRMEVWLSIVAALVLTSILLWLLDKYSPYSAQNNPSLYPYECRKFTLKESFWFALTSFTPQGGGEAPKSLSARVLVSAYWLFVVLMLATFTANLAAFLTVERMQSPVKSLEQLAKQSRIIYTVVNGSSTHQYFKNMKFAEDTLYRVWKEITLNASSDQTQYRVWDYPIKEQYGHILYAIEQGGPVSNISDGIQKVIDSENGEFALIHDSAEIKYEVTRNCNLTEVGEIFAEHPYALAVQQGSRLQEEISRQILDLQRDRFFEGLTAKYWNASNKGYCYDVDDNEGITLESLGGVFIATIFGLLLAMITLAVEVYFHKKKRKQLSPELKEPPKKAFKELDDTPFPNKLLYEKEFQTAVMRNRKEIANNWRKGANKIKFITVQPRGHLH